MKIQLFLILFIALSIRLIGQNKEVQHKFEKEISTYFGATKVEKALLENHKTNDFIYKLNSDNSNYGYAVLSSAKGRMDYFDFMVIYTTDGKIEHIKVLVYRSQHGYEITNKKWLKQFYNKSNTHTYGKDIQAISGATFSAKSITEKINELNLLIAEQAKQPD